MTANTSGKRLRARLGWATSIVAVMLVCGCAAGARHGGDAVDGRASSTAAGRAFDTPDAGWAALVAAVQSGSTDEVLAVLGDDARPFISSADGLNDVRARRAFL